jgi:hypothetical protein
VEDAMAISPWTLTTTMHFDPGETGWFTLGASAGAAIYTPAPTASVPEPSLILLLSSGLAGIAGLGLRRKKAGRKVIKSL